MMPFLFSILSGLLLSFLFPKFNLFYLAWIALVPLLIAVYAAERWEKAVLWGGLAGVVFFGVNLFWVASLGAFVGLWAYAGWVGVVLLQTAYFLIFVIWAWWLGKTSLQHKLLVLPAGYVVVEWLRSLGPYGVTAGGLGYSQSYCLPLLQLASIASVYGISFVLVMANVFLAEIIQKGKIDWKAGTGLCLLIFFILAFGFYSLCFRGQPAGGRKRVFLVQGNISQKDKMDPRLVLGQFFKHLEISKTVAEEKPDFVIWPETAVSFYLFRNPGFSEQVFSLVKKGNFNLIFGVPTCVGGRVYNSMVLVDRAGNLSQYNKEQLVPFGEYLPFRPLLFPLLSGTGFLEGDYVSGYDGSLLEADGIKIGGTICFESTFPGLVRARGLKGAEVLLVITNDAWFFNSAAPYQHLQAGVLRAVENRCYLIQCANTGISAIIDPWGRVVESTQLNEPAILKGGFYPCAQKRVYSITGDFFVFFCLALVVYGAVFKKRSAKI